MLNCEIYVVVDADDYVGFPTCKKSVKNSRTVDLYDVFMICGRYLAFQYICARGRAVRKIRPMSVLLGFWNIWRFALGGAPWLKYAHWAYRSVFERFGDLRLGACRV